MIITRELWGVVEASFALAVGFIIAGFLALILADVFAKPNDKERKQ